MVDRKDVVFLVWGPPSHGPRSQVLARELGVEALHFVYGSMKRGLLFAPFKYASQAVQTLQLLFRKRPRIVLVQSPPSPAVFIAYIYCTLSGSRYLVDAHSAAFAPYWTFPKWLHRHLARRALATMVTNTYFQEKVQQWGGRAFVLRDIPTKFPQANPCRLQGDFNIIVINTFAPDEPLNQILEAAARLPDVQFYVTGRYKNGSSQLAERAPKNVLFTGFVPNDEYYAMLSSSQSVMCLTNRDHTMQRGACEGLWIGKPIITSDWPLLREYFCEGTVHVTNSVSSIVDGVLEMKRNHALYVSQIGELQCRRRQEWEEKFRLLSDLLSGETEEANP